MLLKYDGTTVVVRCRKLAAEHSIYVSWVDINEDKKRSRMAEKTNNKVSTFLLGDDPGGDQYLLILQRCRPMSRRNGRTYTHAHTHIHTTEAQAVPRRHGKCVLRLT